MTWLRILVPLALGVVAVGCKNNSINSNSSGGDVVGASGGIAKGPEGEELRIPGGALQKSQAFTLSVADASEYPGQGSYFFRGKVFAFEPHGMQFLTPATVVVPYESTPTDPVILKAEQGASSWTELAITGTEGNTFEAAVTSLSYFVVADRVGGNDGGTVQGCSGRGPSGSASEGSVSNASGVIPGTLFSQPIPDVDTASFQSGTAGQDLGHFTVVLADYAQACGYATNADYKIGGTTLTITFRTVATMPSVQTYALTDLGVDFAQIPSSTTAGSCGDVGNSGSAHPTQGTGVNITAADGTHVAGTYDLFADATHELQGTFDVPICPFDMSINPTCCLQ